MKAIACTASRAPDAETLDKVVEDRAEVIVTQAGDEPVVIIAPTPTSR